MATEQIEPAEVVAFRQWLSHKGATVHSALRFAKDKSGMSVYATEDIPENTSIISCPFAMAITPESSKGALRTLSQLNTEGKVPLEALSGRELICTYLVMHWILEEDIENPNLPSRSAFQHLPYLHTLPPDDALRTAMHFNVTEISLLKGTNLFGAIASRRIEWKREWQRCRDFIGSLRQEWGDGFTWQRYLTASTYLSSRAFPSTVLSKSPSLVPTESSHPILLPLVDSLNHARAHQVSWVVDGRKPSASATQTDSESGTHFQISLVIHSSTAANAEIFNNYGPKPNSELILGYGFSLLSNPDDTIVLRIGGSGGTAPTQRWEVGHDAQGVEGLWAELSNILVDVIQDDDEESTADWKLALEAAEILKEMVASRLDCLPGLPEQAPGAVRADVWCMIQHYVQGQREILRSLSIFSDVKRENAFARAKAEGLELVCDEEQDMTLIFDD